MTDQGDNDEKNDRCDGLSDGRCAQCLRPDADAFAEAETPAVVTPDTTNPTAPVAGANSFTEEQARARLQEAGYTTVSGLKLDDKGIWQAAATKDGKPVNVALDYQGNIVAN